MIDPFRRVEPPPGGLARLRAQLDGQEKRRSAFWVPALTGAAVAGALIVAAVLRIAPAIPAAPLSDPDSPGLIALGLAPALRAPVTADGRFAVEAVSSSPEVLFYRIASLPAQEAPTGDN